MLNLPEPHAPEPLLLTIVEAARLLSVGRTTVYELIDRGEIRAVRIGRACRVPVTAVNDYVARLLAIEDATPPSYRESA
ncbi:MAG TPA: helix-turn-helix domain-containing protein [Acidimicrobiales bacterium]|nr:helix-turn-helix domain-containing protein [Acidimicrobiales bacterium]